MNKCLKLARTGALHLRQGVLERLHHKIESPARHYLEQAAAIGDSAVSLC